MKCTGYARPLQTVSNALNGTRDSDTTEQGKEGIVVVLEQGECGLGVTQRDCPQAVAVTLHALTRYRITERVQETRSSRLGVLIQQELCFCIGF